jgi:hypothetical protein
MDESKTDIKLALNPSLKFEEVEASLGSVEANISLSKVVTIVITSGIGGARPTWLYRKHRRHPIVGTRVVYAIVAYSSAADHMTIHTGLTASVSGRFGLFSLVLPRTAEAQLVRTIP